ncbi:hypothetical protein [Priestia taiwanensis]|uniref:Uncharacterized protein n=1 Tax=Priestia taiwanensis TaxID=1347902 RepID=A0A917ALS5_9BACI|nr:hypothetical protein [Priestia taiwanensis]MBM7362214.1 phosphotransferase system glucose/maltose/N-acetylglucosamine-specific IIC component [Priestia taiwanensis]GGE60338.1 hypothetical protein GCM10007140_08360 [Priestia taiwanensis]
MHDRDEKERNKEIGARIAIGVLMLLQTYHILANVFTLIFVPEEVNDLSFFLLNITGNIVTLGIANYYYNQINKIRSGYISLIINCFFVILLVTIIFGAVQNIVI